MRKEILEILEDLVPSVDFEHGTKLATDGYLDSFSIVNIVAELSISFGISVPFEEVTPENFDSLDAIVKMVERLQA